jgi:hypothetical protein
LLDSIEFEEVETEKPRTSATIATAQPFTTTTTTTTTTSAITTKQFDIESNTHINLAIDNSNCSVDSDNMHMNISSSLSSEPDENVSVPA